jgi:hypothetical protein
MRGCRYCGKRSLKPDQGKAREAVFHSVIF